MASSNGSKIMIDSSFWVAEFSDQDAHHPKAITIRKNVTDNDKIYINNLIVYETLTVLTIRINRLKAINFGQHIFGLIDQGEVYSAIFDEPRERVTWQLFRSIKKKDISFTDCSILTTIKEFDIDRLLTFDQHFKQFEKEYRFKVN